jgi:hypothetical protein
MSITVSLSYQNAQAKACRWHRAHHLSFFYTYEFLMMLARENRQYSDPF